MDRNKCTNDSTRCEFKYKTYRNSPRIHSMEKIMKNIIGKQYVLQNFRS